MSKMKQAATIYARRLQWAVFPCYEIASGVCACGNSDCDSPGKHPRTRNGCLDATTDEAVINSWWSQWPEAHVGVATGEVSGFDVLDIDPRHGGDESLAELEAEQGELPATIEQLTGGGGRHLLFKHREGVRNSAGGGLGTGLDVRGDGGYIIVAPSMHASGRAYCWEVDHHPLHAEMSEWTIQLPSQKDTPGPAPAIIGAIHEGNRATQITSLAGSMRRRGISEEGILAAIRVENKERCVPPLDDGVLVKTAASVARYAPAQMPVLELIVSSYRGDKNGSNAASIADEPLMATDMGNARRLVRRHKETIRHCGVSSEWLTWDQRRWGRDRDSQITEKAKDTVEAIALEADAIADDDVKAAYVKHAVRSQGHRSLQAMVALAASDPEVCVEPETWDQHHMLLNVENGTIDLETGRLRDHRREDMITQISEVPFTPGAGCPRWEAFLLEIMGKQELVGFLQRVAGYCLTGTTDEDAFFILHGAGMNGKTTFLETLQSMMGDFAQTAESSAFLEKRSDTIPNDLAALRDARLAIVSETGARRSLNEALIKRVTGGDQVTARFLHQEFFTYRPGFKLVMATNDRPRVYGTDLGIWRRIRMVPFTENFEGREDAQLSHKLEAELPGILNWAVEGCLQWQREGLGTLPEVEAATQAYREDMDVLGDFVDEYCEVGVGEQVTKSRLYEAYVHWAGKTQEKPLSKIGFGKLLVGRLIDLEEGRVGGSGARYWRGIGLRSNRAEPDEPKTDAEDTSYSWQR